jgi:hypothetical protein
MKSVRLAHFYLGVFFAPLVIFYAFTGALQVFKLHEAYRDTPGSQGDWIAWFGQFHKEQAFIAPRIAPARAAPDADRPAKAKPAGPMKWLVAVMGAALAITTLLGLYIAFGFATRRRGFIMALVLGVLVPGALLFI